MTGTCLVDLQEKLLMPCGALPGCEIEYKNAELKSCCIGPTPPVGTPLSAGVEATPGTVAYAAMG